MTPTSKPMKAPVKPRKSISTRRRQLCRLRLPRSPSVHGHPSVQIVWAAWAARSLTLGRSYPLNMKLRSDERLNPLAPRQSQTHQLPLILQINVKIKEWAALALRHDPLAHFRDRNLVRRVLKLVPLLCLNRFVPRREQLLRQFFVPRSLARS